MNTQVQITGGQFQNPYKQFTLTLQPQERAPIYYAYDFVRILSVSGATTALQMKFGDTGDVTNVVGAGIGFKLPVAVQRLDIINTDTVSTITITVALCIGYISDDRLNVSGTVNTSIVAGTTFTDAADVSILAGATTLVAAANSLNQQVIISNLAANGTVVRVGSSSAGAARGIEVPIGGTVVLDTSAAVYVYNPSAGTINIGRAEIRT